MRLVLLSLLAACGDLNKFDVEADTGIDVVVVHRGGDASDGSSGGSSGDTDPAQSTVECFWDEDADGHGNGGVSQVFEGDVCPSGWASVGDDWCEDNPSAYTEADCVAQAADVDADGVTVGAGDCDDTNATVNPGASETCNEVDDDCDGETDEDATDALTWYTDADADGYGDAASAVATMACDQPSGSSATMDDCDDTDGTVNPGATEVEADGIDNDCDGALAGEPAAEITCCLGGDLDDCMMTTDAACPSDYIQVTYGLTCCTDGDNDGYGDADECLVTAAAECSDGYVDGDGDCDDSQYGTSPVEDDPYGDGRDQDCDGYDG